MKEKMMLWVDQVSTACKVGHVIAAVEAERQDNGEVFVYAFSPDDSVLTAVRIEQPGCPLDEIEQGFTALAGTVIGTERALAELR